MLCSACQVDPQGTCASSSTLTSGLDCGGCQPTQVDGLNPDFPIEYKSDWHNLVTDVVTNNAAHVLFSYLRRVQSYQGEVSLIYATGKSPGMTPLDQVDVFESRFFGTRPFTPADIQNFKTNTSSGDVENKWSVLVHLIETTLLEGNR